MIHTDDQNAKGIKDFKMKVNSPCLLFPLPPISFFSHWYQFLEHPCPELILEFICILRVSRRESWKAQYRWETEEDDDRKALTGLGNIKAARTLTREVSRECWRQTSDKSVEKKKHRAGILNCLDWIINSNLEFTKYILIIFLIATHHYEIK